MAENPFAIVNIGEVARPALTAFAGGQQQKEIAGVQARMIIARSNPRDPIKCTDVILQDCTRITLAETALYAYSRGGSDISGPSIRLMETIARRWGNIESGIKEVGRHQGYSECVAYAWDLEVNYYDGREFIVRHWRDTKRGGAALTDERDIYETIMSMGQRRKRACLQTVIPGDVTEAAVQQCEETLHAKADASPEAIKKMVEAFAEFGVTKDQIEARCQRRVEAIRPAQLVGLRRIYTSLRDEMSEPQDWFDPVAEEPADDPERVKEGEPGKPGKTSLREHLRSRQQKAGTESEKPPAGPAQVTNVTESPPPGSAGTAGEPPAYLREFEAHLGSGPAAIEHPEERQSSTRGQAALLRDTAKPVLHAPRDEKFWSEEKLMLPETKTGKELLYYLQKYLGQCRDQFDVNGIEIANAKRFEEELSANARKEAEQMIEVRRKEFSV